MQLECGHGPQTWSNHLLYCKFLFTNHHSNHPCVLKSKYFWQRLLDVNHQSTCVPDHWFATGLQENYAVRMWTWIRNMIKRPTTVLQLAIFKPSFCKKNDDPTTNHPCVLKNKDFWQRLLDVSHQSTCVPGHWFAIGLQENYAVRMWAWIRNMIKSPTVLQLFIYKPSFQPPMRFEKQRFLTTTLGCKPSINMCSRSLICNRVARKLCS